MSEGIVHQNKDILFKIPGQTYKEKRVAAYGIDLPLTVSGTEGKQNMLERIVDLAEQIPDEGQRIFTLSDVIVASDKFINRDYMDQIRRRINMTQLGQLYKKEKNEYGNQKVKEKVMEMAKSLMDNGDDLIKIMKVTGLTEAELLRLQDANITV